MDIHRLTSSLGKDASGHIIHPGLHFPGPADEAPAPAAKKAPAITPTQLPPDFPSYTTAAASALLNIDKSHVSHYLTRQGVTGVMYKRSFFWRKDQIDALIPTLIPQHPTIPAGYLSMTDAACRAGVTKATIARYIEKYGMKTQKVKIPHTTGNNIILIIRKKDLESALQTIRHSRINTYLTQTGNTATTDNK